MAKFIYGLVAGLFIATIIGRIFIPQAIITEQLSTLDFDDTVEAIQNNALISSWNVPKIYDIQDMLYDDGYEINKFNTMELTNVKQMKNIASDEKIEKFSILMPFRVCVYEKDDGSVFISSLNASLLSNFYGKPISSVLKKISKAKSVLFKKVTQ